MRIQLEDILHIQRRNGHARRRLLRQALRKPAHSAGQKIQDRIAAGSATEGEISVLQIAEIDIILCPDIVNAEADMMLSANQINVVRELISVDIQMRR